jgi:hypothetical protein
MIHGTSCPDGFVTMEEYNELQDKYTTLNLVAGKLINGATLMKWQRMYDNPKVIV